MYAFNMKHMATVQDVLVGLASRWSEHPSIAVCNKLTEYVEKIGVANVQYLSLSHLSQVVGKTAVDEELLSALNILSVSSAPLLKFAAILHYDDEEFDLEPEEVDAILSEDTVVHPISGEMIENASEHTEIYYTISEGITQDG